MVPLVLLQMILVVLLIRVYLVFVRDAVRYRIYQLFFLDISTNWQISAPNCWVHRSTTPLEYDHIPHYPDLTTILVDRNQHTPTICAQESPIRLLCKFLIVFHVCGFPDVFRIDQLHPAENLNIFDYTKKDSERAHGPSAALSNLRRHEDNHILA